MIILTWRFYSIINDVLGRTEAGIIIWVFLIVVVIPNNYFFFTADPNPQFSARAPLERRSKLLGLMKYGVLLCQQATGLSSFWGKINK